jgi:hypothetical protein
MRENSFRRKFDNYVRGNPLDADLRRKVYTAVAAKLARVIFGLIKQQTDYRQYGGMEVADAKQLKGLEDAALRSAPLPSFQLNRP